MFLGVVMIAFMDPARHFDRLQAPRTLVSEYCNTGSPDRCVATLVVLNGPERSTKQIPQRTRFPFADSTFRTSLQGSSGQTWVGTSACRFHGNARCQHTSASFSSTATGARNFLPLCNRGRDKRIDSVLTHECYRGVPAAILGGCLSCLQRLHRVSPVAVAPTSCSGGHWTSHQVGSQRVASTP